jgi:hypothetical protein
MGTNWGEAIILLSVEARFKMPSVWLSENRELCSFWSAKAIAFALACESDSFHPEKHLFLLDAFKKHQLALVLNKAVVSTTALQRSRGTHHCRTASLSLFYPEKSLNEIGGISSRHISFQLTT